MQIITQILSINTTPDPKNEDRNNPRHTPRDHQDEPHNPRV